MLWYLDITKWKTEPWWLRRFETCLCIQPHWEIHIYSRFEAYNHCHLYLVYTYNPRSPRYRSTGSLPHSWVAFIMANVRAGTRIPNAVHAGAALVVSLTIASFFFAMAVVNECIGQGLTNTFITNRAFHATFAVVLRAGFRIVSAQRRLLLLLVLLFEITVTCTTNVNMRQCCCYCRCCCCIFILHQGRP